MSCLLDLILDIIFEYEPKDDERINIKDIYNNWGDLKDDIADDMRKCCDYRNFEKLFCGSRRHKKSYYDADDFNESIVIDKNENTYNIRNRNEDVYDYNN